LSAAALAGRARAIAASARRVGGGLLAAGAREGFSRFEGLIAKNEHGTDLFFDPRDLEWPALLEAEWQTIRDEMQRLLPHVGVLLQEGDLFMNDASPVADKSSWRIYLLIAAGQPRELAARQCPGTLSALQSVPRIRNAMFSVLRSNAHITPHRGAFKGILRYHLPLKVADPAKCRLRVGSETVSWHEGKSLIFDDTHEHEAWNDTAEDRVILMIDFERPLPTLLGAMNSSLIRAMESQLMKVAGKNLFRWEEAYGKELDTLLGREASEK